MKKIYYIIQILCLGLVTHIQAQQTPQYTQYMYNMSVVNPAYMIDEPGIIQLGSLYRTQWVGLDGAPETSTLSLNTPINNSNVGLGFSLVNDKNPKVYCLHSPYAIMQFQQIHADKDIK